MKNGHRACYMSREFAQAHNFIPKDAAPGFYGFSGVRAVFYPFFPQLMLVTKITNLGTWPIKVGEKTVDQPVMRASPCFHVFA